MIREKELFNEGVKSYSNGYIDQAIEIFEEVVEKNPRDTDARFNLALCYMRKIGMEKEEDEWYIPRDESVDDVYAVRAISNLNKILEIDPEDREAEKILEQIKKVMDME